MTQTGPADHGTPGHGAGAHAADGPSWQSLFSAPDWAMLQANDRQAARNIVGLFTSVFIVGVIGYLFIAWWVGTATDYWIS
jgi:hypothetical protein